jgi:hypothetical protein
MNNLLKYTLLASTIVLSASCDKGFDNLNRNKILPTTLNPALVFNNAILNSSFPTNSVIYDEAIVQQIVTPFGGVVAGGNFNQINRDPSQTPIWSVYYQNVIKNTHDVITNTKDVPARSNLYNMARIFQSFAFMVLTDEYGNIPYTEGGAGFYGQTFFPKYDLQQDIYPKIIKELTEAAAALNTSGAIESTDLLYAGSIAKWKKFAYSLLLRAGMRLSKKSDATLAKATVQAAVAGGVIMDNADNAYIRHDGNYTQPVGNMLNGSEGSNFYLVKAFVDTLKNKSDPRLSSIAVRYKGATSANDQTDARRTTAAVDQIGMPMGFNDQSIKTRATADGLASFYDYSQVDRTRLGSRTAPVFLVTAAQTQLLLAEARFRGWITTSTAAQYFSDGIRAHMDQMATYNANSAVSPTAREIYVAANPLVPGRELEQINTQYWIASFLNGPEAFANFRRTGFPVLTPNPIATDVPAGTFIRRLVYPVNETSVNAENIKVAIAAQGEDKLSTQVWWDKP